MGLSFHYNGRIAKPELLPELIVEVQEIAGITKLIKMIQDKMKK